MGIPTVQEKQIFRRLPDQAFKGFKQRIRIHGLAQMGVQPGLQALLHILVKGIGGQRNDGNACAVGTGNAGCRPASD